jgi:predicted alpha-1,6-mannanase (GH76 family)
LCAAVGAVGGAIVGATATAATGSVSWDRIYYTNFLDDFYDDDGWWALAWIKAYDLTGDMKYLNMAATIFTEMQKGWDEACNGGLYWQRNHQDPNGNQPYKNAIANELFLAVSAALYLRFAKIRSGSANNPFANWANWEWAWFSASGLINHQNLINDALNTSCQNDQTTPVWTYNQGVILSGLCDLTEITGDLKYIQQAEKIATAFVENPVVNNSSGVEDGILTEYTDFQPDVAIDHCQFKGIFVRNLGYLFSKTKNAKYKQFLIKNALSAVQNMNSLNQFGRRWNEKPDEVDFVRQTSGLDLLNAAMIALASAPDLSYLDPLLFNDDKDVAYLEPLLLSSAKKAAPLEPLLLGDTKNAAPLEPLLP